MINPLPQWAVSVVETGDVAKRIAGVWTHDEVERRLREAMTTLRRIPMHANGMPSTAGATWPDYPYNVADRAGWIIGAGTPEYLRRNEADQNRTRLHATADQIREMDECLQWQFLIRDRRHWVVVDARSQVWPESERHIYSYNQLARKMNTNRETVRQWYRAGIKRIARELSK